MRRLGRQSVTILRPSLVDDGHGNTGPDWGTPQETVVAGCAVEPGTSQENLQGRDAVLVAWTVYAPYGIDVQATDRIRFNGIIYSIFGQPQPWDSFSGRLDHTVLLLQDWRG